MNTLVVRSGGGMPGLDIHAGISLALEARGIEATHCIGTSAGAIVSAFDANGYSAGMMANIIRSLNDDDVREERFLWKFRPFIDYIFHNNKIRDLLAHYLPLKFEHLAKPLGVHCTRNRDACGLTFGNLTVGTGQKLYTPGLREAVLASMSIHGFFPSVELYNENFSDGGTTANVPVPYNLADYDEIIICIASPPVEFVEKRSLVCRLVSNVQWLMRGQIDATLARVKNEPNVTVVWPDVEKDCSTMRFRHSLIEDAGLKSLEILEKTNA